MNTSKRIALALIAVTAALSGAAAQNKEPPPNKELEALHAHFARVVARRHAEVFSGITSVADWQRRRQSTRAPTGSPRS
jgi:hypothetical protein